MAALDMAPRYEEGDASPLAAALSRSRSTCDAASFSGFRSIWCTPDDDGPMSGGFAFGPPRQTAGTRADRSSAEAGETRRTNGSNASILRTSSHGYPSLTVAVLTLEPIFWPRRSMAVPSVSNALATSSFAQVPPSDQFVAQRASPRDGVCSDVLGLITAQRAAFSSP